MKELKFQHSLPAVTLAPKIGGAYYAEAVYLSGLESSPQKSAIAWVRTEFNFEKRKTYRDLYALRYGKTLRLTSSRDVSQFVWLDEESLLFTSESRNETGREELALEGATDEPAQIWYRLELGGGEAVPYLKLPKEARQLLPLGEERYLLLVTEDANWPSDASRKLQREAAEHRKSFRYVERLPFYLNGVGFMDRAISRLYLYEKDVERLTLLTPEDLDLDSVDLHEAKDRLLFTAGKWGTRQKLKNGLYELTLADRAIRELLPQDQYYLGSHFYWNDEVAVLATDGEDCGLNQNPSLAIVKEGALDELTGELNVGNALGTDLRQGGSCWARFHEDRFYCLMTRSNRVVLEAIERDGSRRGIVEDVASVEGFDFLGEDLCLISFEDQELPTLKLLPEGVFQERLTGEPVSLAIDAICEGPTQDEALVSLCQPNPPTGATAPERFRFESNGDELEGWVLLPEGYSHAEARTWPAIFNVHGGPKTIYGSVIYHEMQYWLSLGYVVFYTNPHGSAGRGDAFSDIRGRYGEIDYEDLMTFLDEVLERYPGIDPERVGMTGGSYGGFMANWMLTHTDRFAAFATQRSISNWTSFYGTSDIGYYFATDQNNTAKEAPDFWATLWKHSPIQYIDAAKTPTLIVHSAKDFRCPVEQGYQLYNALIDREVPAAMILFHEENHDLSRTGKLQARAERLGAITNWMNHYLKGEALETAAVINARLCEAETEKGKDSDASQAEV